MRITEGLLASAGATVLMCAPPTATAAPYHGEPIGLPGTFEAEHFDTGGEGVGYHDTTPGNQGNARFRTSEDVDVFRSNDSGGDANAIKNFASGERLVYTVSVESTGVYVIELRAATHGDFPNSSFRVEVDGVDLTGEVVLPDTGGWNRYEWIGQQSIRLEAGTHRLEIVSDRPYVNLNTIRVNAPAAAPYWGQAIALPGTFEAEHFDLGGEGAGYHDSTPGNQGDAQFRTGEDVDIFLSGDSGGDPHAIKHFDAGERLSYTVDVSVAGRYAIEVRAATGTDFPDAGYHIEIDGADVTGPVVLPGTGGWNSYQWLGNRTAHLEAGTYRLEIVADRAYFNLSSIRVTAEPASMPYWGQAIALPGTFEAEHFDLGGEGAGYHDLTPGNQGDAALRTGEDVDIFVSGDANGDLNAIKYFESGEALSYTVDVASAGNYTIEVRAATSTAFPDASYRVEIDGAAATGSVALPDTGGWSSYQWVGSRTVQLDAGTHRLDVVAEQPYFNLNSIRVTQPTQTPTEQADLLFRSGFENVVVLGVPLLFGNGAWQDITGLDVEAGQVWPPLLWGGTGARLQLIAGNSVQVTASTIGNYLHNALQTVTGRDGGSTRALYSHVQQSVGGASQNWDSTQSNFQIHPGPNGQGDLYLSYWLRFQPDLLERMTVNNWAGRAVSDWKTGIGTGGGGDYRVLLSVFGDGANDRLYWNLKGDNVANGGLPQQVFWEQSNHSAPVPVGRWFRVEVFVHRSGGSDGRVWIAVDGQEIFDRYGPNMGINNLPWNRIMPFINYSTGQLLPAYQWVDDLELWADFPSTASPH